MLKAHTIFQSSIQATPRDVALMRQFWKTAKSGEVDEEVSTSFREKAGRFILEILKKTRITNLSKERLDNKLEKFIKKLKKYLLMPQRPNTCCKQAQRN